MVGSLEEYERCKFVNVMTASDIPAPWLEVEDGRLRPMADWATMYIPAGDIGFWQAAIRDPNDAAYPGVLQAIERRQALMVEVLYGDHESGRRIIAVSPAKESEWLCAVVRHWNLDQRDG